MNKRDRVVLLATVVTILAPLIGFLCGVVLLWKRAVFPVDLWLLGAMYAVTVLGLTMGYHRLFTHRSFKCGSILRAAICIAGSMGAQGPVLFWVACHRKHHVQSDKAGDPHSPHCGGKGRWGQLHGLWHSHTGWMFSYKPENYFRFVADLIRDPVTVWVNRYYLLWVFAGLLLPGLIGGLVSDTLAGFWSGLLWGGLVRIFLVHHVTWSINSICHLWGEKAFETNDESRNNGIAALLSFGEGWHNNHHAFPTSARHGLQWWQVDFTWLTIRLLGAMGLVWDIRTPDARKLAAKGAK